MKFSQNYFFIKLNRMKICPDKKIHLTLILHHLTAHFTDKSNRNFKVTALGFILNPFFPC